jgi:hypothetical protein
MKAILVDFASQNQPKMAFIQNISWRLTPPRVF